MVSNTDNPQQRLLSVCIPTYEMGGVGHIFLRESLDILLQQTFTDFEVVISDYSKDALVYDVCQSYATRLELHYHKNTDPTGGMAANTNNVIRHATGKIIKILFQDDFLYNEKSLQLIVANFDLAQDSWLITGCEHSRDGKTFFRPHFAKYNDQVYLGKNTLGSPSVLAIKNHHPLFFDPNLKWLVDCDYYRRCYDTFGPPKIVKEITTVIRVGEHQITNTEADEALRKKEHDYMVKKYPQGTKKKVDVSRVTLVSVTGLDPTNAVQALQQSMVGMNFHQVLLIAHTCPPNLPAGISFKQCSPTELQSQDKSNTNDYSKFILYNLAEYIDSDYALLVHKNAVILRPEKWEQNFLDYDYIGAPWPKNLHYTADGTNVRVGNGGFSLRSKKMLQALHDLNLPFTDNGTGYFHEDGVLCVYYRKQLENHGLRFASVDIASRFSREKDCDDSVAQPFGFHDNQRAMPKKLVLQQWFQKKFSHRT